jgi:exodeoxyribonuclease III
MKIATFNINGINARQDALLRWLDESRPDVACLQELKSPQERFPEAAIRDLGYGMIWHGQKSWNGVAILARGADPIERRRVLPGDPEDLHSRYIEATVGSGASAIVVGCLYLPNGNPAPGPKFEYKLRWLERFLCMQRTWWEAERPSCSPVITTSSPARSTFTNPSAG